MPLINQTLLDEVSAEAKASPRLRKNRNFHLDEQAPCHRLINAIEPGSYIPPHCHMDANKDESILVLRGRLGMVLFDQEGNVSHHCVLAVGGETIGIDIPHGQFHSLVALETNTVFFEAKAGPYQALSSAEKAAWAPAENSPEAPAYLQKLAALFA